MLIIGPHVNRTSSTHKLISEHIKKAVLDAKDIHIGVVSIFVGNPRSMMLTITNEEEIKLKEFIKDTKIRVIAHSSYASFPWNGNPGAITYIGKEVKSCNNASIEGLVLHLPKKDTTIIIKYLTKIEKIMTNNKLIIYLETPAFVPAGLDRQSLGKVGLYSSPKVGLYSSPKELYNLFQLISKKSHFGLCIDTAHLWVAGQNIQSFLDAKKWFTEIEKLFLSNSNSNFNLPIIIHLNDSAREIGTGPDKHASLMKGKIWGKYNKSTFKQSGLYFILEFAKKNKIPLILERPINEMLFDDYKILHLL